MFMILPFFVQPIYIVKKCQLCTILHLGISNNHYFDLNFQQQSWIGNKEYVAQKNATDKCSSVVHFRKKLAICAHNFVKKVL